jgi:ABC-type multidrug transport system ATPase subunit
MDQEIDQLTIDNDQLTIKISGLSKRFNREWIFRDLNYTFQSGKTYAITGPNGSGKSTLLQILWGQLPQSSGSISYSLNGKALTTEELFNHVSIATPYMDLIEEFTLTEQIEFHFRMRAMRKGYTVETLIEKLYLSDARDKAISNFSSGMRQRLKLGLGFYTEAQAIFLDEPGTNLDDQAFAWYHEQLRELPPNQLIVIATNQHNEYPETAEVVNLIKFK